MAASIAVIRNPYAGLYEPDLLLFMTQGRATPHGRVRGAGNPVD
jgi:hypothetical protein